MEASMIGFDEEVSKEEVEGGEIESVPVGAGVFFFLGGREAF